MNINLLFRCEYVFTKMIRQPTRIFLAAVSTTVRMCICIQTCMYSDMEVHLQYRYRFFFTKMMRHPMPRLLAAVSIALSCFAVGATINNTCMWMYIYVYKHIYDYFTKININNITDISTCKNVYKYIHVHVDIYTHIYIYTYICVHLYTYTYIWMFKYICPYSWI